MRQVNVPTSEDLYHKCGYKPCSHGSTTADEFVEPSNVAVLRSNLDNLAYAERDLTSRAHAQQQAISQQQDDDSSSGSDKDPDDKPAE